MEGLPFCKVESEYFRKYMKMPCISVNTFMKYMHEATIAVEKEIAKALLSRFALVFDCWTCEASSMHYLAVFASYLDVDNSPQVALLAFSAFENEADFTAAAHQSLLASILAVFKKDFSNIVCLIGDNCAVNQKLAKDCGIPLVGCAAHQFNLEVQRFFNTPGTPLFTAIEQVCEFLERLPLFRPC